MTCPRRALLAAAVLTAACGHATKPALFAESKTFHTMSGRVHGILQVDVDGDGREDAVLAERRDQGFVVSVLRQEPGDPAPSWKPWCTSDVVEGEDIDALRLVALGTGPTVFVLVLTENPEELRQAVAVVDLAGRCKTTFSDQIDLERPEPEAVLAPAGLKGGAGMSADGTRLTIDDEPDYLHLAGTRGEVRVLTSLRERVVSMRDGTLAVDERTVPVLAAARLTAAPDVAADGAAGAGASELPELVDGRDDTRTVGAAGEVERLRLASDRPLVLLELHSGCGSAGAPALTLSADGSVVTLGERPPAGAFVRATGLGSEEGGLRKDLVALRDAPRALSFEVGPKDRERCLRELRGYGFAAAAAVAATTP